MHIPSSMTAGPAGPAPSPFCVDNIGDISSDSYSLVMFSSMPWMNEEEEETEGMVPAADVFADEVVVAQRRVVGSRELEVILGASRERLVGEMGLVRLMPWGVPPAYVNS